MTQTVLRGWIALAVCVGVRGMAVEGGAVKDSDGRIEVRGAGGTLLGWQAAPLANPAGGVKFAGSAFLHPLRTPAGFEWTRLQPADHRHHFGVWWPWKHIEVDGIKYNTWELQDGQGAHVARQAKKVSETDGQVVWAFENETLVKMSNGVPRPVIRETATVGMRVVGDSQMLDIDLRQTAIGAPVTVSAYRYSGFSWRGPAAWSLTNSLMTTSEGLGRDAANGKPARWVMVSGPTPTGTATILLMSAAARGCVPERLRVWDSKNYAGTPFINFNPVMEKPLPLDEAHPAVSHRVYRIVAADRLIDAAGAESLWQTWISEK